jgi:hypothetical protein
MASTTARTMNIIAVCPQNDLDAIRLNIRPFPYGMRSPTITRSHLGPSSETSIRYLRGKGEIGIRAGEWRQPRPRMRSRRIRSPSRRERRPLRPLQVRPALAFASSGTEESLPSMQGGSPTCRPPGHYGAEWSAFMKLATAASCREASVYACAIANQGVRPRSAHVITSPNGPSTHCRLPTKPEAFWERVSPQPRQPEVAAAVRVG